MATTSGPTGRPAATITEAFDHVLEADPRRPALVGPTRSLSYAELAAAADAPGAIAFTSGTTGVPKGI